MDIISFTTKLVQLAEQLRITGHDLFFDYASHVSSYTISFYAFGWAKEKKASFGYCLYFDSDFKNEFLKLQSAILESILLFDGKDLLIKE